MKTLSWCKADGMARLLPKALFPWLCSSAQSRGRQALTQRSTQLLPSCCQHGTAHLAVWSATEEAPEISWVGRKNILRIPFCFILKENSRGEGGRLSMLLRPRGRSGPANSCPCTEQGAAFSKTRNCSWWETTSFRVATGRQHVRVLGYKRVACGR